MTEQIEKTKSYLLTREYLEELAGLLNVEFDQLNVSNLKISFNEGPDSEESQALARLELIYINMLSMIRVIESGFVFPPKDYILN